MHVPRNSAFQFITSLRVENRFTVCCSLWRLIDLNQDDSMTCNTFTCALDVFTSTKLILMCTFVHDYIWKQNALIPSANEMLSPDMHYLPKPYTCYREIFDSFSSFGMYNGAI